MNADGMLADSLLSRHIPSDQSSPHVVDSADQDPLSTAALAAHPRLGPSYAHGYGHVAHTGFIHPGTQSRDASVTRGRILNATPHATGVSSRTASAHPTIPTTDPPATATAVPAPASASTATNPIALDTGLQRRTSNRHHRQTSVINGLQHSRNPSFNSPLTTSPLSPESLHNANIRNAVAIAAARRGPASAMDLDSPNAPFALASHLHGPSIDSTLNLGSSQTGSLSSQHTQSSISNFVKTHAYNPSISAQPDGRTPSEYAMHHLFNAFVAKADQKINSILSKLDTLPLPVEQVCGIGADPAFDQLLLALGHVSRYQPKPLVDSLMFWRQKKADDANNCKKQLGQYRSPSATVTLPGPLPRRHTEPSQDPNQPNGIHAATLSQADDFSSEDYMLLERQATVSIYILCRGLVEVFEQSTLAAITSDLALKLEDIVFVQLTAFEPHHLNTNKIRTANWRIYSHLLGRMSRIDFSKVTGRFLQQLKIWQQDIASSTATTAKAREFETRIELLLLSMQQLRLSTESVGFVQSCEFLQALAQLFADSHGPRIKQAYCATFDALLGQVTSRFDLTEHEPKFKELVGILNPRINQMLTKMRHWASALPTSINLLCLSPFDTFNSTWLSQMNGLSNKLQNRATRTPAMRAICQLCWTYMRRSVDALPTKAKKIEDVVRLIFPAGKKPHVTTEPSMAEASLYFIRLIGLSFTELCFRSIILPLVNPDGVMATRDLRIEQLEPEKVTIGIKAFLLLMRDKETRTNLLTSCPEFHTALPAGDPMSPAPASLLPLSLAESHLPLEGSETSGPTTPVDQSMLDESTRACYIQFCEILGKVTMLCDSAFGSSATFNEKFSSAAPKTPLVDAFTLSKREDGSSHDQRQLYYDLLDVAIQAIPRCILEHVPLSALINLLCTASAHSQLHVAHSANQSLKAIAGQGYAQSVATAFPRFIFNYDHHYSTMSDEGRLGTTHIGATLTLYLELLQVWLLQIQKKAKVITQTESSNNPNSSRALQMEMTNILPLVDEIEGYGLFFLCSQSRKVRGYALRVLETVLSFDGVLGKEEQARIFTVLESQSDQILEIADDALTVLERSRLQRDKRRKGAQNVLLELSSSDNYYDSTLWFKAFPNVVKFVFEMCPHAVALSRELVCDRLALMQPDVERLAVNLANSRDFKLLGRSSDTPINVFFDQWKLYLVMACVTLSSTGGQSQAQLANALHTRKASRNTSGLQDKLSSARALFSAVIPMLGAGVDALRSAVVTALGSINRKLYRILLESLQYAVITCNDEAKARRGAHQRTPSSPSRSQMTERMRTEVTCIYKLTASFLKFDEVLRDEWILHNLTNYAKELRLFLSDSDVQSDWKYTRLRIHYCGLVEELYSNILRFAEPSNIMSFEARKSAFTLMEEWCGYHSDNFGPSWSEQEIADKSTMAKEKMSLRTAALSAMSALCAGPIIVVTDTNTVLQFNLQRMLSWIDSVFTSREHKLHEIGRKALKNLILHNPNTTMFVEHAIQCCYGTKGIVALENYFNVIADILMMEAQFPISRIKIIGATMFTLGHESRDIRVKSAKVLRFLDDKDQKSSNLQHFDITISDKTRAVYKAAQFEYCRRLAQSHLNLAFHIFSEFCLQFRNVAPDIQRSMVAAILPWLQTLELQVLPETNAPTDLSHMLLVNMIEITIRSGTALHNEVQALWQALATGPYGGNVQLILDFIIELSLERREQNFVYCAKQIVVYLSVTPAGSKIFDFFLLQLAAKNMPNERKLPHQPNFNASGLPYVADLETILPTGNRQASLSLGQISMIFLVDLLVPPVQLSRSDALTLLHAVFILWDHHTTAVQEHAREMLVHLMHILVVTRMDGSTSGMELLAKTEVLVEAIRSNDTRVSWLYADLTGNVSPEGGNDRVPPGMRYLAQEIVEVFTAAFDNFSDAWAKEALHWASVCPVRHLACRSFQVFRCISVKLDAALLSDMLARLSNTIADEHADYQTFSLEILTTLKVVIAGLDHKELLRYPQLVWTTIACLNTIHEREFFESLGMLESLCQRFDFADSAAIDSMLKAQPTSWEGIFEGVEPLVYKGLKSSECLDRTFIVLEKLAEKPDSRMIASGDRLLFNVLAYLPRLMQETADKQGVPENVSAHCIRLSHAALASGNAMLGEALKAMVAIDQTPTEEHVSNVLRALKTSFTPVVEAEALVFILGLLANATSWFRVHVLKILHRIVPIIDMKNPNITNHGADLISPLLRLLQTEHCDQALKVMDFMMEVSVTPLERQHVQMSISSGPSRAIRKEYERTHSLYGMPEDSGWSIPTPAVRSAQTRNNVHHVFFACSDSESNNENPVETPDIEFDIEEDQNESYFPPHRAHDTINSYHTSRDIDMGDIVSSLDSLDDFFEENESPTTPTAETRNDGFDSFEFLDGSDHRADIYDDRTMISSRSYSRPSSSMNSHSSTTDNRSFTSQYHKPQFSFSSITNSYHNTFDSIDEVEGPGPSLPNIEQRSPVTSTPNRAVSPRPGVHTRSITSPVNQYPVSHPSPGIALPAMPTTSSFTMQHSSDHFDDVLSDSESTPFPHLAPTMPLTGPKSVNTTPTSATATDASAGFMRRGMRRLTGGKSESAKEKARLRAPSSGGQNQYIPIGMNGPAQSPRVPRVPSEYLRDHALTNGGVSPGPAN